MTVCSPAADAGIDRRIDVEIPAGKERMAAWLYASPKATASNPGPAIVLAHGLGATKELKLDVYAAKFNELGYTCLVFDYRCNGASTGLPRGLIDWNEQQKDWHTALAYVRAQEIVDPERVGIFGTSFGGGHVIQVGAQDPRIKLVISQCPFTHGWKSALCTGYAVLPRIFILGVMDRLFGSDKSPYRVSLVGAPGESESHPRDLSAYNSLAIENLPELTLLLLAALMNAPDVLSGFYPLIPYSMHEHYFTNQKVPARLIPSFPFNRPGSYAKHIQCPAFFAVCGKDSVAPAQQTLAYAKQAPEGTIKVYEDMGHFDIYIGEKHDRAWKDYAAFATKHLPA